MESLGTGAERGEGAFTFLLFYPFTLIRGGKVHLL